MAGLARRQIINRSFRLPGWRRRAFTARGRPSGLFRGAGREDVRSTVLGSAGRRQVGGL